MSTEAAEAQSPCALFVALWRNAVNWSGPERAGAKRPSVRFDKAARYALLNSNESEAAYSGLAGLIGNSCKSDAEFRGQVLGILKAIDEAFYLIHPRGAQAAAATGVRAPIPGWLRDCRDNRLLQGVYFQDDHVVLVPRGPLLRGARHAFASSADSLSDRFAALGVARSVLDQDGRKIPIKIKVVSPSVAHGVPPGLSVGAETVAFIPIAESASDIVATARREDNQTWIDFRPHRSLDATRCITEALGELGGVDLAVAPEFMVSEGNADELALALANAPAAVRLLVAGSGGTVATTGAQAWNEARMLNSSGVEIWRQRKLWPAGIDGLRAKAFGVAAPDDGTLAFEDNAAGDHMMVIDADGLGRCVVLICQDLLAEGLASDLISAFQPDWVFVPLLDSGVGKGRWMHRRAFELSAKSQSRFVFVTSTSLAAKAGYADPACALVVGPQAPPPDLGAFQDPPNAMQIAAAGSRGKARFAVIQWRNGRWLASRTGAD